MTNWNGTILGPPHVRFFFYPTPDKLGSQTQRSKITRKGGREVGRTTWTWWKGDGVGRKIRRESLC